MLNLDENEFKKRVGIKEKNFPISNGKTITIETLENENSFFVFAITGAIGSRYPRQAQDRIIFSDRMIVDDWNFDAKYSLSLKLGFFENQFIINKI